jgi:hypothetical protein
VISPVVPAMPEKARPLARERLKSDALDYRTMSYAAAAYKQKPTSITVLSVFS